MICKKCKKDLPEKCFRHVNCSCKNRHGNGKIYHFISVRTTCIECEHEENNKRASDWIKIDENKNKHKKYFKKWYEKEKSELGDKYVYCYFIKRGLKVKEIPPELIEIKRQLDILKLNIKNYG